MKNEFIKKVLKGVGVSFASTLLTASVFFGQGMTALAEEPEEADVNEYLNLTDLSEEYFIEETDQISFEDYIDYEIDLAQENQISSYNSSSFVGRNLTGNNKLIYDRYKALTEQIANGDASSSICTFSLAELGLDKQYSFAELGITVDMLDTDEGTEAVFDALYAKSGFGDIGVEKICAAVRADCPYERYWMGLSYAMKGYGVRALGDGTANNTYLFFTGNIEYCISVNTDYRGSGKYDVNTAKTKAVKETISSVNGILATAKSKSDREKINFYKDSICTLTEYNLDAIYENLAYGDPWQLVYVFDNNPSTNVVCEGYSKAFQYLCEKTQFSDPSIVCYTVTGYMGDLGDEGEAHMWNVIHWNDNTNYMVDITNTDGNGDGFYMALPASGDVRSGYVFSILGYNILYVYDEESFLAYKESELTLSKGSANNNEYVENNNNNNNNNNNTSQSQEEQVKEFVKRFYVTILQRPYDDEGLTNWANVLLSKKMTAADVAHGFVFSDEFKDKGYSNEEFVARLYSAFFNREAANDPDGASLWINSLYGGKSRDYVFAGFVGSDEFKNLCASYGIEPGSYSPNGESTNPQPQPQPQPSPSGIRIDASGVDPAKLDEFMERLYNEALGRPSDPEGKQNWANAILSGQYDAGTVARYGFFASEEYINKNKTPEEFVHDAYRAFFGRDEDQGGFDMWVNGLKNGTYTRDQVIEKGFGYSDEFIALLESYGFKVYR